MLLHAAVIGLAMGTVTDWVGGGSAIKFRVMFVRWLCCCGPVTLLNGPIAKIAR